MAQRQPTTDVSEAEPEQWFRYWYESDRNYEGTSRHFKRAKTTIYRYSKKNNWDKRADAIRANIVKANDRKIEREQVTNVNIAQDCLTKEVEAYLDPKRAKKGNLRDIVALFKYIDEAGKPNEIAEALRAAAKQDELPFDPDLAAECLDLLTEALTEQKERLDET